MTNAQRKKSTRLASICKSTVMSVSILFFIVIPVFLFVFSYIPNNSFWWSMQNKLDKEERTIRLQDITNFEWDTACIFYGYSWYDLKILEEFGLKDISEEHRHIIERMFDADDSRLFVFALEGKTLKTYFLRRTNMRFRVDNNHKSIPLEIETSMPCVVSRDATLHVETRTRAGQLILKEQ